MSDTLLNRLLNGEIELEKCMEWLRTGNDEGLINEIPCTRGEFVIYFTNYLRNQTECVLRSTSSIAGDSLMLDSKSVLTDMQAVNNIAALKIDDKHLNSQTVKIPIDYFPNNSQNIHPIQDKKKRISTRLFHEESDYSNRLNIETNRSQNNQYLDNVNCSTPKGDKQSRSFILANLDPTLNNLSNRSDMRYAVSTPLKEYSDAQASLNRSLFVTPIKDSPPINMFSPINTDINKTAALNINNSFTPRTITHDAQCAGDQSMPQKYSKLADGNQNQRRSNDCTKILESPKDTSDGFYDNGIVSTRQNVNRDSSHTSNTKGHNASFNKSARGRSNVYIADFINPTAKNVSTACNSAQGGKKKRHKYVNMSLDEDLISKNMHGIGKAMSFDEKLNIQDNDMFPEIGSKSSRQYNRSNRRRINPTRLNSTNPESDNSLKSLESSLSSSTNSRLETAEFGVKYHEKIEQNEAFKVEHNFKALEHATNFQEERSILKKEREKVMEKFSLINSGSEKTSKAQTPVTLSKHILPSVKAEISFLMPDPSKVFNGRMLDILADLYAAMLNYNLIMNMTSEVYFLISLIVSQQAMNNANESVKDVNESSKKSPELLDNQLENLQILLDSIEIKNNVNYEEKLLVTKNPECHKNVFSSDTPENLKSLSSDNISKMIPMPTILADEEKRIDFNPEENQENTNVMSTLNHIKSPSLYDSENTDVLNMDKENIDINADSSDSILNTDKKPKIHILKRPPNKNQTKNVSLTKINDSMTHSIDVQKDEKNSNCISVSDTSEQTTNSSLPSSNLLKSIHDCVYFALATLYKQKSSLSVFLDKSCLRILLQNDRVKQFLPPFVDVLNSLQNLESVAPNIEDSGFSTSEITNKNVCFFTETDSVDNFPNQQNFFAFKKQRDMFYEIFRLWESQHAKNSAHKMENQVLMLLSLGQAPANMSHLARLFRDQLLATCATTHKENSMEALAKLQSAIGSQQLSHNRLSKLSQRLTGALPGQKSSMGIFEQPTFDKEQVFFRDFIVYASRSSFGIHLIDSLVQGIVKLDHTAFPCLERENNGTQVDCETKIQYLQCVKSLQILGKFLGFTMAQPYCERSISINPGEPAADGNPIAAPTEKFLKAEIAVRSWTQPPIDLTAILSKSLKDRRLILTVPWLLQVLATLDYASLRLPYFKTLLNQLFCIYITHLLIRPCRIIDKKTSVKQQVGAKINNVVKVNSNDQMSDNTRLVLKISIGWLFDLPKFPKEMFYDYLCNVSVIEKLGHKLSNGSLKNNLPIEDSNKKVMLSKSTLDSKHKDKIICPVIVDLSIEKTDSFTEANSSCVPENSTKELIVKMDDKTVQNSATELNTLATNMAADSTKTSKGSKYNNEATKGSEIMKRSMITREASEEIEAFTSLDCLDLVDKDVLTELCPYLRHLRNLLSSGAANKLTGGDDNTNTFRHITPVTSGLDGQAAKRKEAELQSQLEEWFLRSQPSGTRRIVQLVSERVGSALNGMARSQLPAHRDSVTKEAHLLVISMGDVNNANMTTLCAAVSRLREEKSKAFVKRCLRAAAVLGESRCRSALLGLLPYDIPETAANQLVHICTRRASVVLKRVLNDEVIYSNDVASEVKRLARIGLSTRKIREMKEECLEAERILDEIGKTATLSTTNEASRLQQERSKMPATVSTSGGQQKKVEKLVKFDDWFKSAFDAIVELKDIIIAIISGHLEQSEESLRVKNAIESANACSQCSYVDHITKKTISQLCLDLSIMIISTHPATLKGLFDALESIWKSYLYSNNTAECPDFQKSNDFTPDDISRFKILVSGISKENKEIKIDIPNKSKSSEKKRSVSLRPGKNAKDNIKTVDRTSIKESGIVMPSNTIDTPTNNNEDVKLDHNYRVSNEDDIKKDFKVSDYVVGSSFGNDENDKSMTDRYSALNDSYETNDNKPITRDDERLSCEDTPHNEAEFFDTILCSRNLAILGSSNGGPLVWETLSDFLIFLLDKKFVQEDSFTEQCLALYRQDWPQIILQNLARSIKLVSEKRKSISSNKQFTLFLQFLSEFCHNLDQDYL